MWEFQTLNISILSIGTNPLHITHNGFRFGITKLDFNVDSFAIDINFFQALSWPQSRLHWHWVLDRSWFSSSSKPLINALGDTEKSLCSIARTIWKLETLFPWIRLWKELSKKRIGTKEESNHERTSWQFRIYHSLSLLQMILNASSLRFKWSYIQKWSGL